MLQITRTVRGSVLLVNLVGSLNGESCDKLAGVLDGWLTDGGRYTLINFSGLTYLSSEGVKALLHHSSELRKTNGHLVLSSVPDTIFQVFEVGGFARSFDFVDTIDDGLLLLTEAESNACKGDGNLQKVDETFKR